LALRQAEQAEMQRLKRENKRLNEEVEILEGRRFFRPGDRVRFVFVAAERGNHAVAKRCRAIGASVSRFYGLAARASRSPGPR
jgi:hypothetical protein